MAVNADLVAVDAFHLDTEVWTVSVSVDVVGDHPVGLVDIGLIGYDVIDHMDLGVLQDLVAVFDQLRCFSPVQGSAPVGAVAVLDESNVEGDAGIRQEAVCAREVEVLFGCEGALGLETDQRREREVIHTVFDSVLHQHILCFRDGHAFREVPGHPQNGFVGEFGQCSELFDFAGILDLAQVLEQ